MKSSNPACPPNASPPLVFCLWIKFFDCNNILSWYLSKLEAVVAHISHTDTLTPAFNPWRILLQCF
eukprot:m.92383 g.92383  ORF g.92383 m.92383 type:complete len:66 (+) comp14665_c0_seq5:274-471(+)